MVTRVITLETSSNKGYQSVPRRLELSTLPALASWRRTRSGRGVGLWRLDSGSWDYASTGGGRKTKINEALICLPPLPLTLT